MLRARGPSLWTAGGGFCANPDIAPRSTGAKMASWFNRPGYACSGHRSFHVPSLRAMPALVPERYDHQPPCRPRILGWVPRA